MLPLFITFNRKSWEWGRLGLRLGEIKAVNGPSLLLAFLHSHPDTPGNLCVQGTWTTSRTKERGSNHWPHVKEAPGWVTGWLHVYLWRTTRCLCVYLWTERRLVFSLAVSSLTCWVTQSQWSSSCVMSGYHKFLRQSHICVTYCPICLHHHLPVIVFNTCCTTRIASVLCLLYS